MSGNKIGDLAMSAFAESMEGVDEQDESEVRARNAPPPRRPQGYRGDPPDNRLACPLLPHRGCGSCGSSSDAL
jgi:hypothetical protein